MRIEYVPLLQIQRDLHGMPRNLDRFRQYLRTLTSDGKTLDLPPLGIMNPMGKEHMTALLDGLLALDADRVAADAAAEASAELADVPGEFKFALVVVDDVMGGWTNRYATEFSLRCPRGPVRATRPKPKWLKDDWLVAPVWGSEPATERAVREALLTTAHRAAYVLRHGPARTLRDMLAQEGHVMARAGCTEPVLDADDLEYTREVLVPYLDADDMRTAIECLFGDAAGRTLGFTPRGLSHRAGLALALHDARVSRA
jgi:hypothetical protein